jgi:glycosyltransferase involved in cell wall biosynthesis
MSGLRVGVDATGWTNRRGYGRFTRNAVTALVALDTDATYALVSDEEVPVPDGATQLRVAVRRPAREAVAADSRRSLGDLVRLSLAVRRAGFDAFLFPSLSTYYPVPGTPAVVGVHDAITSELPALTLPTRRSRALWRIKERAALRSARELFTVSEAAHGAVAAHLGVAPARLAIVPEAPDPAFVPRDAAAQAAALRTLGVEPGTPYLLYVGGISPHKGIETLLDAVAALDEAPQVLLAGELETEAYVSAADGVRAQIAALGLGARTLLTGFVPDDALAALYSGATAVVNPSRAEGFGLPAVEAAACGAPVLLSDIPAHRESLGDGALFFAPGDAPALAAQLRRVLADAPFREALAARGHERVASLTWTRSAERLRELVRAAAGARP